jgi:hypothetical protein
MNGSTNVSNTVTLTSKYGFVKSTAGTYENITVPLSSFTFSNTSFNKIKITLAGTGGGFYLDYAQLQGGISAVEHQEA